LSGCIYPSKTIFESAFGRTACNARLSPGHFRNLAEREYKIFGYKGKQMRDNIHPQDVARFMAAFCEAPRVGAFTI
jgi:nucleoside-diphosphate-sugar epimerase